MSTLHAMDRLARTLNRARLLLLRIFLGYAALGWGICIAGVFASASDAFDLLAYVGGINPAPIKADPMYDYWLRMASSVFALIGLGYAMLATWPKKFANILPFAGIFMLSEGFILLVHGLRLHLSPTPFLGDTSFCIVGGIGILLCMGSVGRDNDGRRGPR